MTNPEKGRLFVAGEWIASSERLPDVDPFSGFVLGEVCQADREHLELAIGRAQEVADELATLARYRRADFCGGIAEGINTRAEELARLIVAESGKPLQYARGEVARAVMTFTLASQEALRFAGEVVPLDISPAGEHYRGYTLRVALGPVAGIAPFNFPLNLVAHKIASALAVGCPIILKPAPQTPLTALALAEIIQEAGVTPGAVSILPMGIETAELMVRDERLLGLSFTGSDKVGWHLKAIAGKKRVVLELGGNAPAIVHEDADVEFALDRLVVSSFAAAGQVCIKSQRLLVHERIYDRFVEGFERRARALKVGDPSDPETVVGPVIDGKSADRIMTWIDEAVAGGARLHFGGTREGNVVAPTLLSGVATDAKCMTEEVFGPVAVVEKYSDFEEALALANGTRYGLQVGVFTFDSRLQQRAVRGLKYGGVILNDSPMVRVDNYPYGGVKDSGFGREGVRYAMEEFSEVRMVVERRDSGE